MYRLKMNSILTDEKDEKFFGNGPLYLLEGVRKYGSLSASAKAMNMSYSKAFKLIRRSEEALGFRLLDSVSGGKEGGFSVLSNKGETFLSIYKDYAMANRIYGESRLDDLLVNEDLDGIGIVVLASGKGKRFEENKLLYKIGNQPMIRYLLNTLLPVKDSCVVSTIHAEIEEIGSELGYKTALHKEESLSDSIRYGLSLLKEDSATVFVQADQPLLSLTSIMRLAEAYRKDPEAVYRLSYGDRKASPVLFPARYFKKLQELEGEEGGSALFKKEKDIRIESVEALFPWEIWDVDRKEDLLHYEDLIRYLGKE